MRKKVINLVIITISERFKKINKLLLVVTIERIEENFERIWTQLVLASGPSELEEYIL